MTVTATTPTTPTFVIPQYTRRRVLGIWLAAALPMGVLAWGVAPLLAHAFAGPAALSRALIVSLTAGLLWQFALVLWLVGREQGTLRWSVLREALWLRAPQSPRSGRRGGRLWWILLPMTAAFAAEELLPVFPHPASHDFGAFLGSDAGQSLMSGGLTWPLVVAAMMILNTVLGEELLFRGVLLPRMQGAFGRADWVVNGVLFAAYHLHQPWSIPGALYDMLILAYPARRFRSAVISILVHSTQTLFFLVAAAILLVR
ncbi:MAG: Abortive infection protein [Nocardioides sp.]|nr:Abortive infection protein [Nocardioides sp.]